jgi:uncharacterized integral membrane protein
MKKAALLALFLILSVPQFAQQSIDDKLFEALHGHGSFNVVFVILGIILCGVLLALWRLDRKVSKLEKEIKK